MGMKSLLTAAALTVSMIAASAPVSAAPMLTGTAILQGGVTTVWAGGVQQTNPNTAVMTGDTIKVGLLDATHNIHALGADGDLGSLVNNTYGSIHDIDLTLHSSDLSFYTL